MKRADSIGAIISCPYHVVPGIASPHSFQLLVGKLAAPYLASAKTSSVVLQARSFSCCSVVRFSKLMVGPYDCVLSITPTTSSTVSSKGASPPGSPGPADSPEMHIDRASTTLSKTSCASHPLA